MAVELRPPNTIYLGGGFTPGGMGGVTIVNDAVAGVAITPGMLIEQYDDSGALKWRPHASADAVVEVAVALEQDELNLTVDDAYAVDDLVKAGVLKPGSTFWGLIPSGQNIAKAAKLQSNGDGRLKATAGGEARFKALDGPGAVTEQTRIRVEVL